MSSDLDEILSSTERTKHRLREFVSSETLEELDRFCFEFASQEADYTHLNDAERHKLLVIRRYFIYTETYGSLFSRNISHPDGQFDLTFNYDAIPGQVKALHPPHNPKE